MRQTHLQHVFVETIPTQLEEGTLYISVRYRTASHLCPCGCRSRVVTPIKPPRWHLYFDGRTVSLWPSIGRWQLPCQSHYWIEHDTIRWSTPWTATQIEVGRMRDAEDLRHYFSRQADESETVNMSTSPVPPRPTLASRLRTWFHRRAR